MIKIKVEGIDDIGKTLEKIAPRHAQNIMRATVHGIAAGVTKDARKLAPSDGPPLTLRPAIKARREKVRFGRIESTVRVKPKAFFWRFLEYGQGPDGVEHAFFLKAVLKTASQLDNILVDQFGKKLIAAIKRADKRGGSIFGD